MAQDVPCLLPYLIHSAERNSCSIVVRIPYADICVLLKVPDEPVGQYGRHESHHCLNTGNKTLYIYFKMILIYMLP